MYCHSAQVIDSIKASHLRRISFCAPHFGVMRALSVYFHNCIKIPPVSLENPVTGQVRLLSVSAGFGG